jgi:DNA end-binding protein Ku
LNPHTACGGAEKIMPRASWKGFLRLSLVSCPVYLLPASSRTKAIRLHQVWVPSRAPNRAPELDTEEEEERPARRTDSFVQGQSSEELRSFAAPPTAYEDCPLTSRDRAAFAGQPEYEAPATRIALRPVDRDTGREIERDEVVKGYEYERGQFVTFTPEELKALDVESSHMIDLATFVPRAEVDPVYFNAPYYVYPDGKIATEAFGVIGAAMKEAGMAGLGRVTIARRERMVLVEPRDGGMLLITLRSADEVRAADFAPATADIDPDMVAVAETIIKRRSGSFDPATFRDRYQDALNELIEAKLKGRTVNSKPAVPAAPVLDLMAALRRSLQQETRTAPVKAKTRTASDRRQRNLLLPVTGGGSPLPKAVAVPHSRPRKKA